MSGLARQGLRFGVVGGLGTGAYLGLFVLLRGLGPQAASLLARLAVAIPTTWLNARFTFSSRVAFGRMYATALGGLALGAALAAGVLLVLALGDPRATWPVQVLGLVAAQGLAATARFVLLRRVALSERHWPRASAAVPEAAEAAQELTGTAPGAEAVSPVRVLPIRPSVACELELLLFSIDPVLVAEAGAAGIDGFIVDWERRGKHRRQAGEGTQINPDTLEDLLHVRAATTRSVLCRIDGYGPWTAGQVEQAIAAGADELLLPMVRDPEQVDRTLALVDGRCGLGILIETQDAVRRAEQLAARPLSRVYLGLNDLRIDRGSQSLFAPLVDGTVDRVRAAAGQVPFGVVGLTLPTSGAPVPSRLLAAELVRQRAAFTFLRRSFLADTAGRPLAPAVAQIRAGLAELRAGSSQASRADRQALCRLVPSEAAAA